MELIGIREAARRIGVSDTAVRKAIAVGRVKVAGRTESSDRPLLAWPDCEADWNANTDSSQRHYVGSQGSPRRAADEPKRKPRGETAPSNVEVDAEGNVTIHDGMTLNEAKTAKAIYDARLARIEYEEQQRALVKADDVKAAAFKVARTIRDGLLNIPDRVSAELAGLDDNFAVHRRLTDEIRKALEAALGATHDA